MPPKEKLWKLDPHTLGKHLVLRRYLDAWLPIIGTTNEKLLIIDGFSGPGEYLDGEKGSPQIMLDAYLEHYYSKHINGSVSYHFIEENKKRYCHLKELLARKYPDLPPNITYKVENSTFDVHLDIVLAAIKEQSDKASPCFAMIDPFGVSDTPMSVIRSLLKNPKAEVYISLMYDHINRFKGTKEFEQHLTALFGTKDWEQASEIEDKNERKQFVCSLYKKQLKNNGASEVIQFDLYRGNKLIYTIFFASKHWKGSDKMKAAIWKTIPDGSFVYKGGVNGQLVTGTEKDYELLIQQLQGKFSDKIISVKQILEYIGSDQTDFPTDGSKSKVLRSMEKCGILEPVNDTRSRKFTYPETFKFKILQKAASAPALTETIPLF